jgi:outer membrane lipoprotein carrier protein
MSSPGPGYAGKAERTEAERLLGKIESHYRTIRGLSADFEQTFSGPGIRQKIETGRLFLARPRRMRWEYSAGKLFIVNNHEGWLYSPTDRQATRFDAGAAVDPRVPFLFLLGQSGLRREMEKVEIVSSGQGVGDTFTIRLVPRNKQLGISEIVVTATSQGEISSLSFTEANDAVSLVRLYNIREGYVAPPESFQFRPPAGISVRNLSR